jgi:hypothetical protein
MASVKLTPIRGVKGCEILNEIYLEDNATCILGRNEITLVPQEKPDTSALFLSRKHLSVELRNGHIFCRALCNDVSLIRINNTITTDSDEKEVNIGDIIALLGSDNSFYYHIEAVCGSQGVVSCAATRGDERESATEGQALLDETLVMDTQEEEGEEVSPVIVEREGEEHNGSGNEGANDDYEEEGAYDDDSDDDAGVAVDLSVVDTEQFAARSTAEHLRTITRLLCRKNTAHRSAVFHYSLLHQQLPLPFVAITTAPPLPPLAAAAAAAVTSSAPPSSRASRPQSILPVPLSPSELRRISHTHLRNERHVNASQLTGERDIYCHILMNIVCWFVCCLLLVACCLLFACCNIHQCLFVSSTNYLAFTINIVMFVQC